MAQSGDGTLRQDPRLKYVDSATRTSWATVFENRNLPFLQRQLEQTRGLIGLMHKVGVDLLAGTDVSPYVSPYNLPGFGLHDELQHLVRAGLTPMEALRAATYKPAQFLGILDSLGTVESGKLAELVLLEANPLDDIANTRRINAVITGGRVYRKPALEAMLRATERS